MRKTRMKEKCLMKMNGLAGFNGCAPALEVSLGTANKYIHSLGVEKDQFELTRFAAAFNCKPFLP